MDNSQRKNSNSSEDLERENINTFNVKETNENTNIREEEEIKVQRTPEEIDSIQKEVLAIKSEANDNYKNGNFVQALNQYCECIRLSEQIDFKEQLYILYSNKGLAFKSLVSIKI